MGDLNWVSLRRSLSYFRNGNRSQCQPIVMNSEGSLTNSLSVIFFSFDYGPSAAAGALTSFECHKWQSVWLHIVESWPFPLRQNFKCIQVQHIISSSGILCVRWARDSEWGVVPGLGRIEYKMCSQHELSCQSCATLQQLFRLSAKQIND